MFNILHKITYKDLKDPKLGRWLDKRFYANVEPKEKSAEEKRYAMIKLQETLEWGQDFNRHYPTDPQNAFFYVRNRTHSYPRGNLQGRASFSYIWPKFFETFPLGEIWLIDLSYDKWFYPMWDNGKKLADMNNINLQKDNVFQPQEATGFSGESFPLIALSFMETCVFPYLTALYSHTSPTSNLVFLYIPDRTFNYSILNTDTTFSKMFFSIGLDSIYSDEEAFDTYGSKFEADIRDINPIKLKNFFDWFIHRVGETMQYILEIEDPEEREKVAMTLNRAIWDAQIAICSEIPYVSKTHFFGVVDKISNIMEREDTTGQSDSKRFLELMKTDFIRDTLGSLYEKKNDPIQKYLLEITNNTANYLEEEKYTPEDLRDIRNSIHGYNIRNWSKISKRSGELTNNIALLSLPLILYLISSPLTQTNAKTNQTR